MAKRSIQKCLANSMLRRKQKARAKFVPEPEKKPERSHNPLPWEESMVSMMQDLKGNINKDTEHYKALKTGLLNTRKDFISSKKKTIWNESDNDTTESSTRY